MKKIISLSLAVLMLVILLLTATSCGMEGVTGYTRLRDHIKANGGDQFVIALDAAAVSIDSANVAVLVDDEGNEQIILLGYAISTSNGVVYQATLYMTGSTEKARLVYEVLNISTAEVISSAEISVLLTHYTGNELVTLDSVSNILPGNEQPHRQNATALLNTLLLALDNYTTENLDLNARDLGFIALSEKFMAPVEQAEAEEDMGGFLSSQRLSMAILMIVQGMGMVFLVLAILWLVLLIFKKVFYKEDAPKAKTVEEAPAAPVAASNDDALVAAITAAVAAYIESDPALSSQFKGGFRVVSFKKKNGKTSWNH